MTQVYFTDSTYAVIDSMLANPSDLIVESGSLAVMERLLRRYINEKMNPLTEAGLKIFFNAKYLIIRSVVDTKDSPPLMFKYIRTIN